MGSAVVCLGSVCRRGCSGREMSPPAEGPLYLGLGWGAPWGPCSGYGDSPASQEPGGTDRVQFLSVWAAEHFHHWQSLGLGGWCDVGWLSGNLHHPSLLPGTSSEKTLEYTFHWSKDPEPETSQPTAPENTVTTEAWRPGRDSGCQSHGSPSTLCSDSQEPCNGQDLPKRHNSSTKVYPTWETPSYHTSIYCCRASGGGCGAESS